MCSNEPGTLLIRITDFVNEIVESQINTNQQIIQQETNEVRLKFLKNEINEWSKIAFLYKGYVPLKATSRLLRELYFSSSFSDLLDKNIKLFAFTNGVIDLRTNEFRLIRPDDYISVTCGYDYSPKSDPETREEIMNWFSSLFETNEERDYLLQKLAYCLDGDQSRQEFDFLLGKGANGKTQSIALS